MEFPCIELLAIRIPESIRDEGYLEILFNRKKYKFRYSIERFVDSNNSTVFAGTTRAINFILPVGEVAKDIKLSHRWGIFLNSPQIEKLVDENNLEFRGGYFKNASCETMIISGWQNYDYNLVFIPFIY